MLLIGQERSKENAALAVEPGCASDCSGTTPWSSSSLQQFQAHTTSAKRWPVLLRNSTIAIRESAVKIGHSLLFSSCLASLEIRTREPSSRTIVRWLLRVSTFPGSPGNSIMLCGSRVGEGIWLGKYTIGLKKN